MKKLIVLAVLLPVVLSVRVAIAEQDVVGSYSAPFEVIETINAFDAAAGVITLNGKKLRLTGASQVKVIVGDGEEVTLNSYRDLKAQEIVGRSAVYAMMPDNHTVVRVIVIQKGE